MPTSLKVEKLSGYVSWSTVIKYFRIWLMYGFRAFVKRRVLSGTSRMQQINHIKILLFFVVIPDIFISKISVHFPRPYEKDFLFNLLFDSYQKYRLSANYLKT